mmetsp:Transcript_44254/g.116305  ORF Transcript_44254/g.116305 Transcript_44254/m.116305 type:complete len:369 (+) Transcript_44254:320-1426(+)
MVDTLSTGVNLCAVSAGGAPPVPLARGHGLWALPGYCAPPDGLPDGLLKVPHSAHPCGAFLRVVDDTSTEVPCMPRHAQQRSCATRLARHDCSTRSAKHAASSHACYMRMLPSTLVSLVLRCRITRRPRCGIVDRLLGDCLRFGFLGKCPEADGAVIAARGVRLSIGSEASAVYRPMVALVAQQLLSGLVVVHIHPEVAPAGNEGLALGVQRCGVDAVAVGLDHTEVEAFDALIRLRIPEGHLSARGNRECLRITRELHRVYRAVERQLRRLRLCAYVPEPERLIVTRGEEERWLGQLANNLNGLACLVPGEDVRLAVWLVEIKDAQFSLLAPSEQLRGVGRPVEGAHNVLVLELKELVAGEGIPHLG